MIRLRIIIILCFLTWGICSWAEAPEDNLPLWEAGLFLVRTYNLDYPGAEHGQWREFLFPTFKYRGKILRAEENEPPRARLIRGEMYDFDLSASGSFSAASEANSARDGMPDLQWLGEVGPRYNLWFIRDQAIELRLSIPLRSVFATDFARVRHVGFVFLPSLFFEQKNLPIPGLSFFHQLAFQFIDQGLADYYFTVDPAFARADRPAYRAEGSYLGEMLSTQAIIRSGRFFTTVGLQIERYKNSSFIDSPLLKRDVNYSGFVGLGYDFVESEARARD